MNAHQIKALLDSCFVAKSITENMKPLPKGLKPRHIHIIDAVSRLGGQMGEVRISDVSRQLNITTPSVTLLIHELAAKGALVKYAHAVDKRVTLLRLTALGQEYEHKYVTEYHTKWAKNLENVCDADVELVVRVMRQLAKAMPGGDRDDT